MTGRPEQDSGSGSIYVLIAALVVLALGLAAAALGDAVVARHQAESVADLAAVAGASAAERGGDGCSAAAAYAGSAGGRLLACRLDEGGTLDVTVGLPTGPVLARFGLPTVSARARAGPAPER